ncbi:hypothetical protein WJX75_005508 [Coccomyxa subellipsoidea]|uniref:Ubiquitin-like domain-containing protein n=1 Tax=Coccomyxa subellipsoidea TaxID=248742 RepID=A0ABR2YGM9_9CHLO
MAIKVLVQHGKNTYELHADSVDDLNEKVEEASGVLARHQRLIYKGKVLAKGTSLAELKLKDASKVMLMASSSTATQGQVVAQDVGKAKAAEARERARQQLNEKDKKAALLREPAAFQKSWQERAAVWAKTGVASIRDAGFAALTQLTVLALDHNQLTEVSGDVGALVSLRNLNLAHNSLIRLPAAVENSLAALPESLGRLQNLRSLLLDKNRLKVVPAVVLRGCGALATLALHGNPVTVEQLREADGFAEFNARRCAKHDKQLEMQVFALSGGFDEGADQVQWQSWGATPRK